MEKTVGIILDGKALSEKIRGDIAQEVKEYLSKGLRPPTLAVILVGEDPASQVYVSNKEKACQKVGIRSLSYRLPYNTTTQELLELIAQLNADEEIDGILVQLPLPSHINQQEIILAISPKKDVDGFHPENMGRLVARMEDGFIPCTPLGIDLLLNHYGIELKGKDVVIVGAGFIVGRPLSLLMLWRDATVSVCHIYTKDIKEYTKRADILISATGVPGLIKAHMVKEGAVVVDVGISRVGDKIVGDVDFEEVKEKAYAITPVPGGVGPMTVTGLLLNTLKAYKKRFRLE
ncbi:MAG: bifunctional methylenetetrahydrofolate dehydrogenase/methenyltetrahydrofolate cyclohydrolase FolD [Aquificota bacterium]|nr:bifunctional methylenetetrahydrofolate dehydrogenase/methenyltetrahydrofolate cyclohydrolase FolD [Aquificaceae bacterium]MDM7266619.1 bifunctional methylenetetrahydrofolate dehydrogenase/methenyltetrahydrofolate cyclohydrolase FolD [Aquificaceae bacterium]HAV40650.1 bifunctional methylenetetrahydrofolate dehydrogenase/methenyltetrahydrofolate cyclohydrolase FolD [Aquificaceae bacterium]HCO39206.1 bifunctional methylenetetrahydrofolate dehydrogenase/methenyltetrahydrofolate cyclohydrolase Fol